MAEAAPTYPLGFPVTEQAWSAWALADFLSHQGTAPQRLAALRELVARANAGAQRAAAWQASDLFAIAAIVEAQRHVFAHYCEAQVPGALQRLIDRIDGRERVPLSGPTVNLFNSVFPPGTFLGRADGSREMSLVRLLADNPAVEAYRELFDDAALSGQIGYPRLIELLATAFEDEPPVEGLDVTLFEALRAPVLASPTHIDGQIDFILAHLRHLLTPDLVQLLMLARGVLKEEQTQRGGGGPGPAQTLRFGDDDALYGSDEARFTADRDWMTDVLVLAKSTYVWLSQLSTRFGRDVYRLNEIPDEALDELAAWGITGLWLIGVWERSDASRQIKHRMGNPEALASAYSLHDYAIADNLGGEDAWNALDARCKARGIRLACDMVPNHTGVDSDWVRHHPERFLQTAEPPYPGYRFDGPDLCGDPGIGVYLEDGYWDHSDAAVVFKRVEHATGATRYIYHGNDGTHMPWNDTAQLNYLDPEVREAVIGKILEVARRASIIRFDAAMTLAKRHIRRLWYPPPGDGGAIPSRAERGMPEAAFDRYMPAEFWREVVDRIQAEAPDTLLIAEAFWLMEGYFVRTLGMHRVYNSAFMHMLRDEDNAEYRESLKNVLAYSPAILQRFVNFMNNPDEETAIEQFGDGDKYFGVALLLVTLPGLPLFGHGQVEGLREKYGMEYACAYQDEHPNQDLIDRHAREIFPLMRRRQLFSQCDAFALYDLRAVDGSVQESAFVYSNRAGGERALIMYNNAYVNVSGWVRDAVPMRFDGVDEPIVRGLVQALGLTPAPGQLLAMREARSGKTFLRDMDELASQGLFVELGAYQSQVFIEMQVLDADDTWRAIAARLGGAGADDLDAMVLDEQRRPQREALQAWLAAALAGADDTAARLAALSPYLGIEAADAEAAVAAADPTDALALMAALSTALPDDAVGDWDLARAAGQVAGDDTLAALLPIVTSAAARGGDLSALAERAEAFLEVNTHDGETWFSGDQMALLIDGLDRAATACGDAASAWLEGLVTAADAAEYRWDRLVASLIPPVS